MSDDARKLLEESAIIWKRDFDALLVGFAMGVLVAVAILGALWR